MKPSVLTRAQYVWLLMIVSVSAFSGGAVLTWFATPTSVQAQDSQTLQAQQIRIVDSRGRVRMSMGVWPPGNEQAVYLGMNDANGQRRLDIGVSEQGAPWAAFWDRNASAFGLSPTEPTLRFYNARGQAIADLPRGARLASGLPQLSHVSEPGSGGKADSARPEDVRSLQSQIDAVRIKVNQLVTRVNALSQ